VADSTKDRWLKIQFQRKLNDPGAHRCGLDLSKVWSTDVGRRIAKLGVVKDIEKFRPELQVEPSDNNRVLLIMAMSQLF
jgi:hypothetical protein